MNRKQTDKYQQALKDAPQLAVKWLNTSASDAGISALGAAQSRPAETLIAIAGVLALMNEDQKEKKAHRQALAKAARKAIGKLAEVPA